MTTRFFRRPPAVLAGLGLLWFILALFHLPAARATNPPTLTVHQPLRFGTFGMHDNKSQHTITIHPGGTFDTDTAFAFGTQPQRGEYDLTDLPVSHVLTITVETATNALAPDTTVSPSFTVKDYTVSAPATTDASGNATFYIGATLVTSGAGPYYKSDHYAGTFSVFVDYGP